jgi:8-oxo-dGTP pyrophosphatase MutT (NUDIX family)
MNAYDSNFALYEIATKSLIWKGNEILLVIQPDGKYDFPGGRMDKSEMSLDLFDILTREIAEELGSEFKFKVRDFAFISKRYYKGNDGEHNILAIFFNIDYLSGAVQLSDEHIDFRWIEPKTVLKHPELFVTKDEFMQYKKYFD